MDKMYDIIAVIISISTEDRQQNLDMLLIFFFPSFFVFEASACLLVNDNHISIFKLFSGSLLRNYVFPELHYFKKRRGGGGLCANEEGNKRALEFQSDAKRNRFIAAGKKHL